MRRLSNTGPRVHNTEKQCAQAVRVCISMPAQLSTGWCDPLHGFVRTRGKASMAAVRCQLRQQPPANASRGLHTSTSGPAVGARTFFVGCVRDGEKKLVTTMLPLLDQLGAGFAERHAAIYENDSRDGTRAALLAWLQRASSGWTQRALLLPEPGQAGSPTRRWLSAPEERTQRIARCRNTLLSFVLRREVRSAARNRVSDLPAFLVVLDLDCKRRVVDPTPLARAVAMMLASSRWDVLAANSQPGLDYYDLWALRSDVLGLSYDCWTDAQAVAHRGTCDAYEIRIDQHAPVFASESAFNGLAVYRLAALLRPHVRAEGREQQEEATAAAAAEEEEEHQVTPSGGRAARAPSLLHEPSPSPTPWCLYEGVSVDGLSACEHVAFHTCLRLRGVHLGIAPFLVQGCGNGAPRPPPPLVRVVMLPNGTVQARRDANNLLPHTLEHYMRQKPPSARWWDGRAFAERHGWHVSCITRPCSAVLTRDLAEIDPCATALLLAALIVLTCGRLTRSRLRLLLAFVVVAALLLLLPPRPSLLLQQFQDHFVEDGGPAHECIRRSSPQLPPLRYPRDAEAHFVMVHTALRRWLLPPRGICGANYCGEKVEDLWRHHFASLAGQRWPRELGRGARGLRGARHRFVNVSLPSAPLRRHFGSFIPIFVPWNRWLIDSFRHGRRYPRGLLSVLRATLRPDTLYVTVAQDDQGLVGSAHADGALQNILVLSAGGYGHVPLPLLNQPEAPLQNLAPPGARRFFVSYVGSRTHAPHSVRQWSIRLLWACCKLLGHDCPHHHGEGWRDVMRHSRFSLCPRGFGRSSYHIAETLQLGLIPIHVYSDRPWLPYARVFHSCGYAASVFGLPRLLWRLVWLTDAEVLAREARARELAASHFSLAGVAAQVQAWLIDEPSDLLCTRLPPTVRDEEAYPAALALGASSALLAALGCVRGCRSRRRRAPGRG